MKRVRRTELALGLIVLLTGCANSGHLTEPTARPNGSVTAASFGSGPFAYVANGVVLAPTIVSVIDAATHSVVADVPTGGEVPRRVVISRDGATAYVLDNYSMPSGGGTIPPGSVTAIDVATNTIAAKAIVGVFPREMVLTPDGAFLYVTNQAPVNPPLGHGSVSVISTATNTVVATLVMGWNPGWLAVSPDGAFVYVSNGSGLTPWISVIDVATNTVATTVFLSEAPGHVAFTRDGAFAYASHGSGLVSVIETATHTQVATVPVPARAGYITMTRDGRFAYVLHGGGAPPGIVSVIETATNTVVATIPVGDNPQPIVMSRDGAFAYTPDASGSAVYVIATASHSVVSTVPVSPYPSGLAVSPDGSLLYAASPNSGSVTVVETAGHTPLTSVHTGRPVALAFAPALTPERRLQNLIDNVQALVDAGILGEGGNGLLGILGPAYEAVLVDRPSSVHQLEAFISAVEAEIASGRLSDELGQELIDEAQSIIDQLSA